MKNSKQRKYRSDNVHKYHLQSYSLDITDRWTSSFFQLAITGYGLRKHCRKGKKAGISMYPLSKECFRSFYWQFSPFESHLICCLPTFLIWTCLQVLGFVNTPAISPLRYQEKKIGLSSVSMLCPPVFFLIFFENTSTIFWAVCWKVCSHYLKSLIFLQFMQHWIFLSFWSCMLKISSHLHHEHCRFAFILPISTQCCILKH